MTTLPPIPCGKRSVPLRLLTDRKLRPLRHVVLIVAVLLISVSRNLSHFSPVLPAIGCGIYGFSAMTCAAYLAVAYLHMYVFVPRFLSHGRYATYFLGSALAVFGLTIFRCGENLLADRLWGTGLPAVNLPAVMDALSDYALNMLCFTGVSLSVQWKYWMREEEKVNRLEAQRRVQETEALKESVDPATLLDAIHRCGINATDEADGTAALILQLSELLRYQLYESGKEKVFLHSEIGFIRRFLEFEQARNRDFRYVLETAGNGHVYVPALGFMPFIKNGVGNPAEALSVRFLSTDNKLIFSCKKVDMTEKELEKTLERFRRIHPDRIGCTLTPSGKLTLTIDHE